MNSRSHPGFLRRLFSWRSARGALLALAIVGTLIAGFYVVENTRGRRAWLKTQAAITANGYSLPRTFAELAPPPVPPEDNAAETPALRALYDPNPAIAEAALSRWKVSGDDPITPALFEQHAASLAELAEAVRRPHLRFPVAYEKGFSLTVPHVGALHAAARLLSARVTLRLQQGDAAGAADDAEVLLRLPALLDNDSLLICQLIAGSISKQAVDAVAEGLARNAWTAPQRARLAAALARIDLLGGLHKTFLVEWGASSIYFEGQPDLRLVMADTPSRRMALAPLIPSGWFDQARALMGRVYMENIIPSVDTGARRVDLPRLQQAAREIVGGNRSIASGHALAALIVPTFEKVVANQAEHQTRLDFARLALALADWRDAHGAYPATLAELPTGASLATLHDLLTGQPFTYQIEPTGDFRLQATAPEGKEWSWPAKTVL